MLTGENTYKIDRKIGEIVAGFEGDVVKIDGSELMPEMLPDLFMGVTLFETERLIVIKNVSTNKLVWGVLGDWLEKAGDTTVVLVENKPDKRTKAYKWLEKHAEVTHSGELTRWEAVTWLEGEAKKRGIPLSHELTQFFVDYVGIDQWRLESELEKIVLSRRTPSQELIREVVEPTPQATSFELLDATFAGRQKEVERIISTVAHQEDPYMFLGLLSSQVFALALVKSAGAKRPEDIARQTGVHPYVLKKVLPLTHKLSSREITQIIAELAKLDADMKSRSVEPWTQIQLFLASLSK